MREYEVYDRIETLKTELDNTPRTDDFCNVDLNCKSGQTTHRDFNNASS